MKTEQKIIEKQDELIEILTRMTFETGSLKYPPSKVLSDIENRQRLISELTALKSQAKELSDEDDRSKQIELMFLQESYTRWPTQRLPSTPAETD